MTIINHTYGFVFIHIPKNAGTSVGMALAPLTTYRDLELGATDLGQALAPQFRKRFGIGKHATLREVLDVIGPADAARYRTFCVTRDPFDRVASMFSFLRRWTTWHELPTYRAHVPEFLECRDVDEFVASRFFATPGPDRLFLPQMEWIRGPEDDRIGVDRLLTIHDLERGLLSFLGEIGVPGHAIQDVRVVIANDSPASGSRDRFSERSVGIIRSRYAADFDALGYAPTPP